MNITKLLEDRSKAHPVKPAVIFKGETITFRQLRDISLRFAASLAKLGVKNGEKIAIYLPNMPEYIYSYLAIWCVGATAVPLDFMLTEDELLSCINHSEAKILIARHKANISFTSLKENCPALEKIILCQEAREDFVTLKELLAKEENNFSGEEIPDKEYAIIFYTSGTTGKPKGVLINYLQLEAPSKAMVYFAGLGEKDIALSALPFSHLGGLLFIQAIVFLETTTVLMERFIPLEFLKNVQNYKVSCFWLVPSMYYALMQLKEFESFDLSSLRWVVCFGAPISADQLRRFHKHCPQAYFIHGWGMTETNAPTVVNPKDASKLESVGKAAPWIEIKIFDDSDNEVGIGQIGEIVVHSWVVTDGYYKDAELTAAAKRNGWFHTGDLGRFDNEGYLYIVGRKKEMIKVAGEIVFEPEVEAAIYKHPDVAEVAVVGVAEKLRGEVPKAIVVLKEGKAVKEEELRQFCREHLAHFKIPHYFEFRTTLPKNRAGKIDKETLRRKLI